MTCLLLCYLSGVIATFCTWFPEELEEGDLRGGVILAIIWPFFSGYVICRGVLYFARMFWDGDFE